LLPRGGNDHRGTNSVRVGCSFDCSFAAKRAQSVSGDRHTTCTIFVLAQRWSRIAPQCHSQKCEADLISYSSSSGGGLPEGPRLARVAGPRYLARTVSVGSDQPRMRKKGAACSRPFLVFGEDQSAATMPASHSLRCFAVPVVWASTTAMDVMLTMSSTSAPRGRT
jgi:hypothetical protein